MIHRSLIFKYAYARLVKTHLIRVASRDIHTCDNDDTLDEIQRSGAHRRLERRCQTKKRERYTVWSFGDRLHNVHGGLNSGFAALKYARSITRRCVKMTYVHPDLNSVARQHDYPTASTANLSGCDDGRLDQLCINASDFFMRSRNADTEDIVHIGFLQWLQRIDGRWTLINLG